jgi:hypothetical protein
MLGYAVAYGWMKEQFDYPNIRQAFEDYEKVLEKHNMKLLFFAGAMGTSEEFMYAIQFDDIKDWENSAPEVPQACPLTRTRTILGWDYTR